MAHRAKAPPNVTVAARTVTIVGTMWWFGDFAASHLPPVSRRRLQQAQTGVLSAKLLPDTLCQE